MWYFILLSPFFIAVFVYFFIPLGRGFSLKIVPSFLSDNFICFRYRSPKTYTWHIIYHARKPQFGIGNGFDWDYNWGWTPLIYGLGNGNFNHERQMFSTYEKVKQYEKNEYQKYLNGRKDVAKQLKEYKRAKKEAYKRANN